MVIFELSACQTRPHDVNEPGSFLEYTVVVRNQIMTARTYSRIQVSTIASFYVGVEVILL